MTRDELHDWLFERLPSNRFMNQWLWVFLGLLVVYFVWIAWAKPSFGQMVAACIVLLVIGFSAVVLLVFGSFVPPRMRKRNEAMIKLMNANFDPDKLDPADRDEVMSILASIRLADQIRATEYRWKPDDEDDHRS